MANFGRLIPTGGGEEVPLKKDRILIGRRDSCDIILRFSNVSGQHCRLTLEAGYWFVTDLDSRNGTKVNGYRVSHRKRLDPGTLIAIAKHQYEIRYDPEELGAVGPPPADDDHIESVFRSSLLERSGLARRDPEAGGNKPKDLD